MSDTAKPINPHFDLPCEACNAEEARYHVTVIAAMLRAEVETMWIVDLGSACYCKWILEQMPKSATRVSA